jgi:hypothetical protein
VVGPMDKYQKTLQKSYSDSNFKEALIQLIIMEDLPFTFSDSPYFRSLIKARLSHYWPHSSQHGD